jgi:hypothetical protein
MTRTGRTVLSAVGALAAIAVGGGIGGVVVHARQTDRDNQISAIRAADAAQAGKADTAVTGGVRADGSHFGSLFSFLVPTPADWAVGDDVNGMGNNTFLTQSQISAQQGNLLNVPKSDQSTTKNTLADLHVQGLAVRSMVKPDQSEELSFELVQLDPKAAATEEQSITARIDSFGWRQGATVPGYPSARCALPPGSGSDKLDEMRCVGSYGDVEVILQVDGTAPLDQNTAVQMLAQQLNRLKSPQQLTVNSPDQGDQNE